MRHACRAGVDFCDVHRGVCGLQDFAGAAEAYGALLQRSLGTATADSCAAPPAADCMSVLAKRAAALLRLGHYLAARADCDAALALLLHEQALDGAGPGGSACSGAARPEAADAAGAAPAASCPSADSGPGGLVNSKPADDSSCIKPMAHSTCVDIVDAPCSRNDVLSFAHALAARLQKEAVPASGLAGEASTLAGACAEAACLAGADGSGGWGRGCGKLALLLRLLVRRGSAFAHDRRCGH